MAVASIWALSTKVRASDTRHSAEAGGGALPSDWIRQQTKRSASLEPDPLKLPKGTGFRLRYRYPRPSTQSSSAVSACRYAWYA